VREAEANEALGLGAASGIQGSEEDSQVWKRLWSSSVAAQAVNERNPKPYTKRGGLASVESRWFSKVAAQAVLNPKLKPKLNPHQKGTDSY
jgi:hypothetical protein